MVNEYNAAAAQKAIDSDKSIGKQEAKAIHALLKGRAKPAGHTVTVTSFRGPRKAACTCGARFGPIGYDGTSAAYGGNQQTNRMIEHARANNAEVNYNE